MLHAADGLLAGHMRQGGTVNHIADGVIARHIGAVVIVIPVVHNYLAALHGDAGLFKTKVLEVGHHAHGAQHHVAVDNRLGIAFHILDGHMAHVAFHIHLLHTGASHHFHTHLAESAAHLRCRILVFVGQDLGHELHKGNLHADTLVEEGELAADGTAAAHHHALGFEGQRHCLAVADNALAVLWHAGHHTATGACGHDDMTGFVFRHRAVLGGGHLHLVTGFHAAGTHNHFHVVLLQQELDTLAHCLGHTARTLHHGTHVGLHSLRCHAIAGCMVYIVEHLGTLQQSFGRDTTPV